MPCAIFTRGALRRLLATVHDGALAAPVVRGIDRALGDSAVDVLNAASAADRAAAVVRTEPLLNVLGDVLARTIPAMIAEDRGAIAETLARLVFDFEHAPLPHAFLVDLYRGFLPALNGAAPRPAPPPRKRARKAH